MKSFEKDIPGHILRFDKTDNGWKIEVCLSVEVLNGAYAYLHADGGPIMGYDPDVVVVVLMGDRDELMNTTKWDIPGFVTTSEMLWAAGIAKFADGVLEGVKNLERV